MYIKRDDLIHPEISGNKWRKLKYNFEYAIENALSEVITFGGAYSNHIAATAAAANHFGIKSTGIIRGDELNENSNPTLQQAAKDGMNFRFLSREDYRKLKTDLNLLKAQFPNAYIIPEGGTNELAIQGASEIIQELHIDFDVIITAIGTGGTMAGLIRGLRGKKEVLGISSLKGDFMKTEMRDLLQNMQISHSNFEVLTNFHFGGYGKCPSTLIDFINQMKKEINMLFDPIYTAKALFGVWEMITNGRFDGQTLVFLHTGGLQGIAGFNQKSSQKIHI